MVYTIFDDITNLFGGGAVWFWYIFFVILIGVWANSKNRNYWKWMIAALLFSPLITGLVLLFSGKLEKKKEDIKEKEDKDVPQKSIRKYLCAKCKTPVKESAVKCPKCKSILTIEGAVIKKKK